MKTASTVVVLVVMVLLSGCATAPAARSPIDLQALDPGNYTTVPRFIEHTEATGAAQEIVRLAGHMPLMSEIDPRLTRNRVRYEDTYTASRRPTELGGTTGSDPTLPGPQIGLRISGEQPSGLGLRATLTVLRYASAEQAESVRADYWSVLAVESTPLRDFPTALNFVYNGEYDTATVHSWFVFRQFLIVATVQHDLQEKPDGAPLSAFLGPLLTRQVELLSDYEPVDPANWHEIPADVDGLLGRTLPSEEDLPSLAAVSTPVPMLRFSTAPEADRRAYDTGEVDLFAQDDSVVLRAGSDARARELATTLTENLRRDGWIASESPPGLPTTPCVRSTPELYPRFACYVVVDRYVGVVGSRMEPDAWQQAAAQYLLLAHGR
ncbi:DUF7373 family lipoprotein [Nocardia caishijiensis]|uniref:Uncharacterized protein n=1 Tax=Nocardia caishijiensis TaxID=184756 RepID=A0ABQ6YTQ8_9NOCA|nr:hypothetical protein [Nocardia caishijiensis]KAF0849195.1 hypothetical protein FNL39_101632 [Nocardia caishijiensis]